MRFENHIALRFLTDHSLHMEGLSLFCKQAHKKVVANKFEDITPEEKAQMKAFFDVVDNKDQRAFFITNTVHDKLDMLRVKKNPIYDWTVFQNLNNIKHTYLLMPDANWDSGILRMYVEGEAIRFCHLAFKFDKGSKDYGQSLWTMFWVNKLTGFQCTEFETNKNVKDIEEFVYKLLCFIFLSENEFQVMQPGEKQGTKKNGKIINSLPVPLTIVNSKWNITSIRTEGFGVSGHFKLVWTGPGRTISRMVFVEPYEKHGYVRRAAMESVK